jgi:hypothetical protein
MPIPGVCALLLMPTAGVLQSAQGESAKLCIVGMHTCMCVLVLAAVRCKPAACCRCCCVCVCVSVPTLVANLWAFAGVYQLYYCVCCVCFASFWCF